MSLTPTSPAEEPASEPTLRHRAVHALRCFALALPLVLVSCASTPDETPPCCRVLKPGAMIPDRSLYQLDSSWTSDVGREIKLGVLQGQPQVVAMVFTTCEFACPIIVNDMKRIADGLPANLRGKVNFTLISFDYERDTPEKLHAFRQRMMLPVANWTLLRGGADDVRELAALLGVNYRKDARGQYAHSNIITLLNPDGEVVFQQSGLNIAPEQMVERLVALPAK